MPISKKIVDEISNLDAKQEEKILLMKILEIEDEGVKKFTAPYEKIISEYIEIAKLGDK